MNISLSELLDGKKTVALGGHIRPDGDCVGSCMGLYLYLREQYPQIDTDVYLEYIPEAYRFIQDTEAAMRSRPGRYLTCLYVWIAETRRDSGLPRRCLRLPARPAV